MDASTINVAHLPGCPTLALLIIADTDRAVWRRVDGSIPLS
jgi:hypothetical protein